MDNNKNVHTLQQNNWLNLKQTKEKRKQKQNKNGKNGKTIHLSLILR